MRIPSWLVVGAALTLAGCSLPGFGSAPVTGVVKAANAIDSGAATRKLEELKAFRA